MPRQQGSDRRRTGGPSGGRVDRSERTVVFGKTKLCKFHILGVCSKGADCNFAHEAAELNQPPDLAKTKVCKSLINTGRCDDPDCRYAHNRDEIREMPTVDPSIARSRTAAGPAAAVANPPAAPPLPQMMPNFAAAFGQPFGLPSNGQTHDPQAQAMVLQQLAAQLSMQAAMIQAAHGHTWTGQQPGASPAAQWLAPQLQQPQGDVRPAKAVPVELAALTPEPNLPAFVGGHGPLDAAERRQQGGKGKGRGNAAGDALPGGAAKNQKRIQNGRVNSFGAGGPWAKPPSDMPSGLTAASMASPLMLPTSFEQDPPMLHLGSLFDSPKHGSPHGQTPPARRSPFSGNLSTLKETEFTLNETEEPPILKGLSSATFDLEPPILKGLSSATFDLSFDSEPNGGMPFSSEALTYDGERRGRLSSHGGEKRLQDTPVLGGIMVKHTFLDIQPEGPKAGMRSVQTHSGSLCLMAEQDDDDYEDCGFSRRISAGQ